MTRHDTIRHIQQNTHNPNHVLPANPDGTETPDTPNKTSPTNHALHKTPRHTDARLPPHDQYGIGNDTQPTIPTAQRHQTHPTGRAAHQSQWHSHTTHHQNHVLPAHSDTRPAQQNRPHQSSRHSDTRNTPCRHTPRKSQWRGTPDTIRPPRIPTAQRQKN